MKPFFFIFICLLLSQSVFSQQWQSLDGSLKQGGSSRGIYADTATGLLYVVGNFDSIGGIQAHRIAVWDGISWSAFCEPSTPFEGQPIISITKYQNEFYVVGTQSVIEDTLTGYLAKKQDDKWIPFGNPNSFGNITVTMENELFLVGYFDSIGGENIKRVAKWNGTKWEALGSQDIWTGTNGDAAQCIVKYKSNYIVGGNYWLGEFKEIAQWDGSVWSTLENGMLGNADVRTMVVYDGILYVGGSFEESAGNKASYLLAWDGSKWFKPFPTVFFDFFVFDLKVIDNNLYIVGAFRFENEPELYTYSKYDGANFCAFGGSFYESNYQVPHFIAGLNGEIYTECSKTLMGDTVYGIAKWIGSAMDTCIYSPVSSIAEHEWAVTDFAVSPNPSSGTFNVSFKAPQAENVELRVQNQLGQELLVRKLNCKQGENEVLLDLHHLASGIYFLSADSHGLDVVLQKQRFSAKLVKQ